MHSDYLIWLFFFRANAGTSAARKEEGKAATRKRKKKEKRGELQDRMGGDLGL
jgi:hypothetical protein